MSGNNLQRLVANFNIELEKVAQWLSANKLILNINKTNYMVFTNKHIDNADIEVCQMQTPLFIIYSLCPCLKYLFC